MGTTLNRDAYQRLIDEDLAWLDKQPRSLEREHIKDIVRLSPSREYSNTPTTPPDFTERDEELARKRIVQAITDIQEARLSHLHWAEYFEAYPEAEKQYESTGEWDNAKVHHEWVEKYDNVLAILARFPFVYLKPATSRRPPKHDYTKHPEVWLRERGRQ